MASSSKLPMVGGSNVKRNGWAPYDIGIMIIDEEPTSLLFVHTLLKTCHYRVISYENPVEALYQLYRRSDEFDLVIADLHMISMPAFNLVERVAKAVKLPVITTCADEDPLLLHQALSCGSCFHLVKPITISSMEFVWKKSWKKKARNPIDPPILINLGNPRLPMIQGELVKSQGNQFEIGESSSHVNVNQNAEKEGESDTEELTRNRLLWDSELHRRFLIAVSLLGHDAVPTSIIGIMNVAGLTVKQVASHLQKHRKRVKKQKQPQVKLISTERSSSHHKSTIQKFPTSLIPTGSKRPIHTLEGNNTEPIRKPPLILPKPSPVTVQLNIQTAPAFNNPLQNQLSFAQTPVQEMPATLLPQKQLKQSEANPSPQVSAPTTQHSDSSDGLLVPLLNTLVEDHSSLFNAPEFDHLFPSVVDSATNGIGGLENMGKPVELEPLFGASEEWPGLDEFLGNSSSKIEETKRIDETAGSSKDLDLDCDFNYKDLTFDDELLAEMIKDIDKGK